jgi:uncharacterized membrane protein YtjA (UPF0391 family)
LQELKAAEEDLMLGLALTFLIVGLIAGVVGVAGMAVVATQVGWILFLVGLVLVILNAVVRGRVPPAA